MRLRTHVLASPAFLLFSSIFGQPPSPPAFLFSALGAVLPEVDKSDSLVGRFFPASRWIEERFGHRGLTHSLLGLALASSLFLPLAFFAFPFWLALFVGYLSHLLLDMATLEGIPLFWPKTTRCVFPGRDELRLDQSKPSTARKEAILSLIFLGLAAALWPLSQLGVQGALQRALGTMEETFNDYRKIADSYEVFLVGTLQDQITGEKRQGEWPIVALLPQGYLIVDQDLLRLVANSGGNLSPIHVSLKKGKPITVVALSLNFAGKLRNLLSYVDPQKEHYISGTLKLSTKAHLPRDPRAYATVRGSSDLTLTYARLSDLEPILNAWVLSGSLVVLHRLRQNETLTPGRNLAGNPEAPPVELRVRLSSLSDLYVKEGDVIYEGETIGKVNTQELERKRREFALALERYALGLIDASEIQKLELGLWELEEACEVKATVSGQVTDIRILSASPEGVDVVLQILPNAEPRSLPPVNPRTITATEKIDPRLKELPELPKEKGEVAYILRVLDGDTVELLYQGKAEKARLVGVDTPETKDPRKPVQCFGPEASNFTTTTLPRGLEARITWNPIGDKRDKYNRLLVYLWVQLDDDEPLELFNAALVRLGYARVYPFFKFDRLQEFRNFEAAAMAEKAGLWGACSYEPYQK
jgi:inner membrane protein